MDILKNLDLLCLFTTNLGGGIVGGMIKKSQLVLDGGSLAIADINELIKNERLTIAVSPAALEKVRASNRFLEIEQDRRVIYGVNTGFGPMISHLINKQKLADLQLNLVRSHAAGVGEPIAPEFVLASMIVRLNTLLKGYSGVSEGLIEQLIFFTNHRILPIVPEHGAVGTSGDLVQLAHIALALIGEGEVFYRGQRQPVAPLLRQFKLKPYKLRVKEGLALINGTAVMTGIMVVLVQRAELMFDLSLRAGAWALELAHAFSDSLDERLHAVRPHPGQIFVAETLRKLVRRAKLLKNREDFQTQYKIDNEAKKINDNGQEVYSLRCLPQILGPIRETLERVKNVVEVEMNSVTDNPVVFTSDEVFLHGGNFHGDYVAVAADQLKMSIVKATLLAERQINYFLNQKLNGRYPPFLNLKEPGLTLGLQGLQFVATSITAQNQSLAYPHNLHSISTNADNQDVVSMGADAALFADAVTENALSVLIIELLILAQATDCGKLNNQLSPAARGLYQSIRKVSPAVVEDRALAGDLSKLRTLFKSQADKLLP